MAKTKVQESKKGNKAFIKKAPADPFVTFGKVIKEFLNREDMRKQEVIIEASKEAPLPSITFKFEVKDTEAFSWKPKNMSRDAYLRFVKAEKARLDTFKSQKLWAKQQQKLLDRTAFMLEDFSGVEVSPGFERETAGVFQSHLEKVERFLYNLSQTKLKEALSKAMGSGYKEGDLRPLLNLTSWIRYSVLGSKFIETRNDWILLKLAGKSVEASKVAIADPADLTRARDVWNFDTLVEALKAHGSEPTAGGRGRTKNRDGAPPTPPKRELSVAPVDEKPNPAEAVDDAVSETIEAQKQMLEAQEDAGTPDGASSPSGKKNTKKKKKDKKGLIEVLTGSGQST